MVQDPPPGEPRAPAALEKGGQPRERHAGHRGQEVLLEHSQASFPLSWGLGPPAFVDRLVLAR